MSNRRRPITLKDVAERAKVAPATAARALGSYGRVSEETGARIRAAARELGYRPDAVARSMITGATHTIGLVVTDIENPFFARIARAVTDVALLHGYSVLVANSDERIDRQRSAVEVFVQKRVDGLIIVPASNKPDEHLTALARSNTALVLLDRTVEGIEADAVMVDGRAAAYAAICYLTNLGHRRIGLITASNTLASTAGRIAGYREALTQMGAPPTEWIRIAKQSHSRDSAREAAAAILRAQSRPTALFATDSIQTAGALDAIYAAKLELPGDVSLIGFDDVDWMSMVQPPVTVVDQPVYELGKRAAERLVARIKGDAREPQIYLLEAALIQRGSCSPPDHSELR